MRRVLLVAALLVTGCPHSHVPDGDDAAPWIGNVLLLPSQSNHVNGNGGNSLFQALFGIPNNERWYAARLGNVQVLNLDSTFTANADLPITEVPWLRRQVEAAHEAGSTRTSSRRSRPPAASI